MCSLQPTGLMRPRMAVNAAQHKIVSLLKTLFDIFVITCLNVFNVWSKTTLRPVGCRDAKRLDTPVTATQASNTELSEARIHGHGDWRHHRKELGLRRKGHRRGPAENGLPNTALAQPRELMRREGTSSGCWNTHLRQSQDGFLAARKQPDLRDTAQH